MRQKHRNELFLCFDIETIPNYELFGEDYINNIKNELNSGFLPIPLHKIVCISCIAGTIVKDKIDMKQKTFVSKNEFQLLNEFFNSLTNLDIIGNKVVFITYNGINFDVPLLINKSIQYYEYFNQKITNTINALLSTPKDKNLKNKHYSGKWPKMVIDVSNLYFPNNKIKLEHLCILNNIPCKTNGHGTDVEQWYKNEEFDKISKYCFEDVKATLMLYFKYIYASGKIKTWLYNKIIDRINKIGLTKPKIDGNNNENKTNTKYVF